jgi:predicted nucleotidyltransferase
MQVYKDTDYIEEEIINTLKYFHIFKFPLYAEEIHRFLSVSISPSDLLFQLKMMQEKGILFIHGDLYMLIDDEALVTRRGEGSEEAIIKLKEAKSIARFLWKFPFVREVCISGSLSKGYADKNSDLDFFIITKANRLWICRTILHLYKKITFLGSRQHSFCMNYFIDESRLTLEEQNIFTATELATLIPVCNNDAYKEFIDNNKYWLVKILPNATWSFDASLISYNPISKNIAESFINIALPNHLNKLLMTITDKWWRYKWKKRNYPMDEYNLAMKTRWYVSKNHPANYQKKILEKLTELKYPNTAAANALP